MPLISIGMTKAESVDPVEIVNLTLGQKIIVCIPAYNESQNITDIVRKARKYATEVIVYDDGSYDNTSEKATLSGAIVVRNPINKGYGVAISALFQRAKTRNADVIVTMDSDGQHDPDEIPKLLDPILRGESDIVIGSRFIDKQGGQHTIPKYRSLGIKAITKITSAASYNNITDAQSGFRSYNRKAIGKIDLFEEGMQVSTEILLKAKENNLRIKEVAVNISYELGNTSTHNPVEHGVRVLFHVLQVISLRHPLLFYGLPGIVLLIIAGLFTNHALVLFSETRYISTNMILVSVGFAIVGAIFLATGAIVYTLVALFKGKLKDV
jgi:glycosyltransferase involved in cell wall biosynthesis